MIYTVSVILIYNIFSASVSTTPLSNCVSQDSLFPLCELGLFKMYFKISSDYWHCWGILILKLCFHSPIAAVEQELKNDRLTSPHYRYYCREMRVLAYTQLLESYRSLTLPYMANAFGVSIDFIDQWVDEKHFQVGGEGLGEDGGSAMKYMYIAL